MAKIYPGYGRVKVKKHDSANGAIFALIALMGVSLLLSILAFFVTIVRVIK